MGTGTRTVTLLAALALVVAGCSGGGDDSGGGDGRSDSLTVWTVEDVAERVQAQQAILDA